MSTVDLHIHTTASDGVLSPEELVRRAAEQGMTAIAIADHDTVDGVAPALQAAKKYPPLRVIPCVEINTDVPDGEVHILGYFIDYTNPELTATLERLRTSRELRAQRMVEKLNRLGMKISYDRVQQLAGKGSIGRPHIAQALLEKGYISSFHEAFEKYIGRTGPAYVEREKVTPQDAVRLVARAAGLPVLAHPYSAANAEAWIMKLKDAGLCGLEIYYANYTPAEIADLLKLTERFDLVATGGSDFHGFETGIGAPLGGVDIPDNVLPRLFQRAEKMGLKTVTN